MFLKNLGWAVAGAVLAFATVSSVFVLGVAFAQVGVVGENALCFEDSPWEDSSWCTGLDEPGVPTLYFEPSTLECPEGYGKVVVELPESWHGDFGKAIVVDCGRVVDSQDYAPRVRMKSLRDWLGEKLRVLGLA